MRRGALLLSLVAGAALAQDVAPRAFETTVRAEARPAPGQATLDARAVEVSGAQSAADALEWDPAVTATSGARGERIITLRGFDQRQVAVLLDGAPFELPYDGQVDLAMVPSALLERIEVLRGPGAVSVGPNGLGGAVNLITRRGGDGPLVRGWLEASPPLGLEARLTHSARVGAWGWTVSGGHREQAAWPLSAAVQPTGYEAGPLRANSDLALNHAAVAVTGQLTSRQTLTATAWVFDGARGMPPSTLDDRPRYWRFTAWRALNIQVAHQVTGSGGAGLDTLAWVRQFDNLVDSYDSAQYRTQTTPRAFSSWYHDPVGGVRLRGRARLDAPWGPVLLRAWAGGQWEAHGSASTPGTPESFQRVAGTLIPEVESTFGRQLTVQAALQGDLEAPLHLPSVRQGTALGPRLTAQWRPQPAWAVSVTGARTTRFAGLKERFSTSFGTRLANPALGPEAAWSGTAEVRWTPGSRLTVQLIASHSEVEGLISTVALAGGLTQLQNVAHAQLGSVEGRASWAPTQNLQVQAGVQALRAVQRSAGGPTPLDYRAPVQGVADVSWSPLPGVKVWAGVRASSARPFLNPDTRREDALPAFAELSVRLEARLPGGLSTWCRATNLLDAAVDGQYGFPRPGRQLFCGLSVDVEPLSP